MPSVAIANTLELGGYDAASGVVNLKLVINKLVRGMYQRLNVEHARKLADYFGCSIEDLFPPRPESVCFEP